MTHLSATLYINRLCQEQGSMIVLAGEGGAIDNIISGITSYVGEKWNELKERPFAAIASFMAPGLLFKLGFPWMGVAYEVAGALGFDWTGLWDSLKNSVWEIVRNIMAPGGQKLSEEETHAKVAKATDEALSQNVHDTVDEEKLQTAYDKANKDGAQDALPPAAGATSITQLIKQAGLVGSALKSRGILSTLFRKIIPWVVTRALISLGFTVAAGAARGAAGLTTGPKEKAKEDEAMGGSNDGPASTTRDPIYNETISPTVDRSLYEFNKNDASSVWLESGSIDNIKSIILGWCLSAFPQLGKKQDDLINSRSFIEVENMFRNRNKLAQGLEIYSVPKPFQRKIDIVSYIVNGYLKTRGNNAPQTQ